MSTRREDRDVEPSALLYPCVERGVVARELRWGNHWSAAGPSSARRRAGRARRGDDRDRGPRAPSLPGEPILFLPPAAWRPPVHRSAGPTPLTHPDPPSRRAGPARSLQSSDAAASGEPRSWPVAPGGRRPAGHPPRPDRRPALSPRPSLAPASTARRPLDDDDRHVPHADRAGEDESGPRALEVEVRGVRDDVLARAHLRRPEVLPMIAPIVARVWRPRAMKMKGIAAGCALAEDLGRARRVGLHELQAAGDALVSPGRC